MNNQDGAICGREIAGLVQTGGQTSTASVLGVSEGKGLEGRKIERQKSGLDS